MFASAWTATLDSNRNAKVSDFDCTKQIIGYGFSIPCSHAAVTSKNIPLCHVTTLFLLLQLDIDECSMDPTPCTSTANSQCLNIPGGYECPCDGGFRMDDNECKGKFIL